MTRLIKSLFAGILLSLCATVAIAAGTATPIFVQTPKLGLVQFLQGTDVAGTYKVAYTGGANGSKIVGLIATTNDASAAHLVTCQFARAAVSFGGTAVNIPISAGFASTAPAINLMAPANWPGLPLDSDGNPFIYMASASDTLTCTFATALTATNVINIQVVVADF